MPWSRGSTIFEIYHPSFASNLVPTNWLYWIRYHGSTTRFWFQWTKWVQDSNAYDVLGVCFAWRSARIILESIYHVIPIRRWNRFILDCNTNPFNSYPLHLLDVHGQQINWVLRPSWSHSNLLDYASLSELLQWWYDPWWVPNVHHRGDITTIWMLLDMLFWHLGAS